VSVPESLILTVHKAGVGGTPLSRLLVCAIRAGGDEGRRGAATHPRLQGLWQVRVKVALVENRRYPLDRLQFNAPLPSGALPRVEGKTVG